MVASYGFELESFGCNTQELIEAMEAAGGSLAGNQIYGYHYGPDNLDSRTDGYVWKAERDGSISNNRGMRIASGHEVISPIMWGQDGLDQMKRTCRALRRAGAEVNPSCGTHVTIGIEGSFARFRRFGLAKKHRAIGRIVEAYDYFQQGFDSLVSESRRSGSPGAAYVSRRYGAGADRYCPIVHFNWHTAGHNTYGQGDDVHYAGIVRYGVGRGVVNVSSSMKVIEFRQHNGTLDGNKLKNWALLLHRLVSWAINDNHPSHAVDMRTQPPTLGGLLAYLAVGSDLRTALEERARHVGASSSWTRDVSHHYEARREAGFEPVAVASPTTSGWVVTTARSVA
jgi:hypothetical protein